MRCKAKTKDGKPCGGQAVNGSSLCFTHSPQHAKARALAHKAGGRKRHYAQNDKPFPECDVKNANGLLAFIAALMRETWLIENSVGRNRALAYMCQVQKGVLEVGEIEDRLEALEVILKARPEVKP